MPDHKTDNIEVGQMVGGTPVRPNLVRKILRRSLDNARIREPIENR